MTVKLTSQSKGAILVTGGAGYIGSKTCSTLSSNGYLPVVLDDLSTGHEDNVRWGPLFVGDISNQELVSKAVKEHHITCVIHFAGSAYVGESMVDPMKYFVNNTAKSAILINTVTSLGIKHFVFSSTCATYGEPDVDVISESTEQRPINPYGRSKLQVEEMLSATATATDFRYVALRYFNAAGGDPAVGLVERHSPETHLIPLLVNAAQNESPLTVNGVDFPTKDGSAVRDFIHIADLADAHVKAVDYLLNGGKSEFVNLGTGHGTSILDLVKLVQQMGYHPDIRIGPRRAGDPANLVANPSKAQSTLGWRASHSTPLEILQTAGLQRK